jgi:hypothetical protein
VGIAGIWFWLWEGIAIHLLADSLLYDTTRNFHEITLRL